MPLDNEVLYLDHKRIVEYITKQLDNRTRDLVDSSKIKELRKELDEKMEKVIFIKFL